MTPDFTPNALEAERLRRSLSSFVREAWAVLEPETPLRWNWHLGAVCDSLERVAAGECRRLIINIPPGSAKSLLVTVFFPAWQWLTRPGWRVLCSSYAKELSTRDSIRCRDLVTSDWYEGLRDSLGLDWTLTGDQNAKTHFQNTAKGSRMSLGVSGAVTGFRGDCTIVDDALNVKDDPTPEKLEDVYRWYRGAYWTRLNDQQTGTRIVIMQRVHEGDLVGRLLDDKDGDKWETLILPMEFEPESADPRDPRTERGELLHPDLFSQESVEELKISLGPYQAAAQLQQQPAPSGGGTFKRDWIQFWYPPDRSPPAPHRWPDGSFAHQDVLPEGLGPPYQSWDCAFKGTDSSDFVVGQEWRTRKADRYLLRQTRAQLTFTETVSAVREMRASGEGAAAVYVEDKANGTAVIDTLKREIPGLIPINPDGGKEARAHAVQPQFEAKQVWLPHPSIAPWVLGLISEMLRFPKGKHDDQVDALTQLLNKLRKRVIVV